MDPLTAVLDAEVRGTMRRYRRAGNWLRTLPRLRTAATSIGQVEMRWTLEGAPAISAVAVVVSPDRVYVDRAEPAAFAWSAGPGTLAVRIPTIDYTDSAREVLERFDIFRRGNGPDPRRKLRPS